MSRLERLYSPPEINAPGKREARGRRRDLLLAGLFVLAMAAAALAALALLSPGLFGGAYRLHAYFARADGLDPGIHVREAGYTIGTVEAVTPVFPEHDPEAAHRCPAPSATAPRAPGMPCFRATLRIIERWPIPSDSTAQIGSEGLFAGEAIVIQAGSATTRLAPGAVITARGREADLLAELRALTGTIQALVDDTVAPALASIEQQIRTIGALLGTGDAPEGAAGAQRERLAGAFESLQRISAGVERALDPEQLRAILAAVREVSDNLAAVTATLPARSAEVEAAVARYGALAEELRALLERTEPGVHGSLDQVQFVLQELSTAMAPILTNIESATRDLSALARELRNDPATLLRRREQEDQSPWFQP